MALDIATLMTSPELTTTLIGSVAVTGVQTSAFSVSASNNYSTPYSSIGDGVNGVMRGVSEMFDINFMKSTQAKSVAQTVSLWENSERPSLPVSIVLVNYDGTDVGKLAHSLFAESMPRRSGSFLHAPHGYKSGSKGLSASGTFTLLIGTYYHVSNLILNDVSIEYSQQLADNGKPLWVNINATFTPYKGVDKAEVLTWYK